MRAVLYRRVSTEEQAESGLGLEAQEASCRRFSKELGAEVVGPFDDDTSGAASLDKRPGLLAAISELQKGDVLLVAKRDRLGSRGGPLIIAMIEAAIIRKGARVVSAAGEGTEGDDPSNVLMRRMIDAFGEYERLIIKARTSAALQAKIRRGERVGEVRYGYDLAADGKTLFENREEQIVIRRIQRWRKSGMSFRAISKKLTNSNVITKKGNSNWVHTSVCRILARTSG